MKIRIKSFKQWKRDRPPTDARLWLLGSVGIEKSVACETKWWIDIYWKRLGVALAALTIVGYLGTAVAVAQYFKQQPYNKITFTHVVLAPVAWRDFRAVQGQSMIAHGLAELHEKHPEDAVYYLQSGLAKEPSLTEARLALADLYEIERPEQALALLEQGLNYPPVGRPLLSAIFSRLAQKTGWEQRMTRARTLLQHSSRLDEAGRYYLGTTLPISLLIEAQDFDAAGKRLSSEKPKSETEAGELSIAVSTRTGQTDAAWTTWETAPDKWRTTPDHLLLGIELARETQRPAKMDELIAEAKKADPENPAAYLLELRGNLQLGRTDRMKSLQREFLAHFGKNPTALKSWGAVALGAGEWKLVAQTIDDTQAAGLDPAPLWAQMAEFFFRHNLLTQATTCVEHYRQSNADAANRDPGADLLVELVMSCGEQSDTRANRLARAIDRQRGLLQAAGYQFVVQALDRYGKTDAAREVAAVAERLYPGAVAYPKATGNPTGTPAGKTTGKSTAII
ncbi:MAG: hypothetical protein JSS11_08645 [Verrucomicrobia bacterium]|nr:hypothetical protein [Verrucomicrobiota bacterium]